MIIFGTRGVNLSKGCGEFYCPECNAARQYKQINVRRFFTLYFIPIIPLDLLGTYVECQRCKGTYKPEVVHYDPAKEKQKQEKFQAEYMMAIKNVMLSIMMADGVIETSEVKQLQDIYQKLTNKPIDEETIRREGKQRAQAGVPIKTYVAQIAPMLNLDGKLLIMRAALEIAAADGQFQPEEQQMVTDLGKILEIPKAKVNELVKQYFQPA